MKELFEQFERQAIDANYPISFSKTDGNTKYFYTQTQSMFDGWLLHYRHSNGVANNVIGGMDACFWEEVDDGECYESNCNKKEFKFNDGNPQDNGFEFCPYCGKKLIVKEPIFDEADI